MSAFRGIRSSKAGIAESLTAVLLAIIAIVIGVAVWAFLNSTVAMQQTSADFAITSAEVRQMTTGQCIVYFNVRNTGGQSFVILEIEVLGPANTRSGPHYIPLSSPLNPGMMYADSLPPISCQPGWVAGTALLVRVTAETPTQVRVSKNVNVIIQFGA
jgi:hypothetical protein